jgi:ribosomal protein L11 methyltransferase
MTSNQSSTFKFKVLLPMQVSLPEHPEHSVNREAFFEWLWNRFGSIGLVGVHEGTLLSEQAAEQGFETDSWTVDSGEAPRERDWVSRQEQAQAELFFTSQEEAAQAARILTTLRDLQVGEIEEQKAQDWDAEWKASFLNAGAGVEVPPFWRVVPPWVDEAQDRKVKTEKWIRINPGAGFGTGTHETTQLCMQAIGECSQRVSLQGQRTLDFGSGSGILSVALALAGAKSVDAVEIDPLAIDNAKENAELNGVEKQIQFSQALSNETQNYRYVIANILKPVLLEFAERLVDRLQPGGVLILSGLIEKDVEPVTAKYSKLLGAPATRIYEKGDWRALSFVKKAV